MLQQHRVSSQQIAPGNATSVARPARHDMSQEEPRNYEGLVSCQRAEEHSRTYNSQQRMLSLELFGEIFSGSCSRSRRREPLTFAVPLPQGVVATPRRASNRRRRRRDPDDSGARARSLGRWLGALGAHRHPRRCRRVAPGVASATARRPRAPCHGSSTRDRGRRTRERADRCRRIRHCRRWHLSIQPRRDQRDRPLRCHQKRPRDRRWRADIAGSWKWSARRSKNTDRCVRRSGSMPRSRMASRPRPLVTRLHFYAGSGAVRVELTLRNPRRAAHRHGYWDLGDPGSIRLRKAIFRVATTRQGEVFYSPETGRPLVRADGSFALQRYSSGGANWSSSVHVTAEGITPRVPRGYRLRTSAEEIAADRATPIVALRSAGAQIALGVPHFWQNFPKAIDATADALSFSMFPADSESLHELQGGEQKTHVFFVCFGEDPVSDVPLDWCRAPTRVRTTSEAYARAGAIPAAGSMSHARAADYERMVAAALDGESAFDRKREHIDEYGWRHFGRSVRGPRERPLRWTGPVISHYNNQYDAVAAFATQFMRNWRLAVVGAHGRPGPARRRHRHLSHRRRQAAYNGGLFWHTESLHFGRYGDASLISTPKRAAGRWPVERAQLHDRAGPPSLLDRIRRLGRRRPRPGAMGARHGRRDPVAVPVDRPRSDWIGQFNAGLPTITVQDEERATRFVLSSTRIGSPARHATSTTPSS